MHFAFDFRAYILCVDIFCIGRPIGFEVMYMRKTKIVCTMGPACREAGTIEEMIKNGMNVARLNFSHGDYEYHGGSIKLLKEARNKLHAPLAIMLDTKGPEIRLGNFEKEVRLVPGQPFMLTTRAAAGTERVAGITYDRLPLQLKKGDTVLIDDGHVELRVENTTEETIECTVIRGGAISSHKGVNVPSVHLEMPVLNEQDKKDILFGIEQDVDYIAASFVRCREDMVAIRRFVDYNGGHDIKLIAKIENLEGIENFDEILQASDGIMVARGDLGVEVDFERIPGLQKRFIRKCYQAGKMVITATQMMESMINQPNPTRAEITDIANAVFDGTSAVMLSGETAVGKYPVEAVRIMGKIAQQAEWDAFEMQAYKGINYEIDARDTTNAVCDAACTTARDISAQAIIALTKYGQTARLMSKFRPVQPVIAATPVQKTFNQLALSWGVYPVMAKYQYSFDLLLQHAIDCAKQIDAVKEGDRVVIVAGIPMDTPGSTNTLKVETVGNGLR